MKSMWTISWEDYARDWILDISAGRTPRIRIRGVSPRLVNDTLPPHQKINRMKPWENATC